ncbi:baseplate wedge subunit [Ochrobactrum phage vB_OspM_OC]|nr:baseplate wedge subunit [Ochrobactrum phage vB_OspM_OC]
MSTTHQNTLNFAHGNKFRFVISDLPNTQFLGVQYITPTITATSIKVPYKQHYVNVGGDKLDYGDLTVTFKIDKEYKNYIELVTWLNGIGKPHDYKEREDLVKSHQITKYQMNEHLIGCDVSIIMLDNQSNPSMEIIFRNVFPTTLTGINLDTKVGNDITLEATVTFAVENMEFKPIEKFQ